LSFAHYSRKATDEINHLPPPVLRRFSQEKFRISGTVKDAKTQELIPGVSVYLEGSTLGTQADSLGRFSIKNVPTGRYQLVASFVGYKPYIQAIEVLKDIKEVAIRLIEDNQTLAEVQVRSGRDKTWEKQMRVFEKAFLGDNYSKKR